MIGAACLIVAIVLAIGVVSLIEPVRQLIEAGTQRLKVEWVELPSCPNDLSDLDV